MTVSVGMSVGMGVRGLTMKRSYSQQMTAGGESGPLWNELPYWLSVHSGQSWSHRHIHKNELNRL